MRTDDIDPLKHHLLALAPASERKRHDLAWAFDGRLAAIARTTTEPMIGQMRMAWWDEALTGDGTKGRGEPLVEAMRQAWPNEANRAAMTRVIDGWEALMIAQALDEAALRPFAEGRGALFEMLGGPRAAGEAWALWDLSGHVTDQSAAALAIQLAGERLNAVPRGGWTRDQAPLRVLTGIVRADVTRGRIAPVRMTGRQYLRLIRLSLGRSG